MSEAHDKLSPPPAAGRTLSDPGVMIHSDSTMDVKLGIELHRRQEKDELFGGDTKEGPKEEEEDDDEEEEEEEEEREEGEARKRRRERPEEGKGEEEDEEGSAVELTPLKPRENRGSPVVTAVKSIPATSGKMSNGAGNVAFDKSAEQVRSEPWIGVGQQAWKASKELFRPGHKKTMSLGAVLGHGKDGGRGQANGPAAPPPAAAPSHSAHHIPILRPHVPRPPTLDIPGAKHATQMAIGLCCASLFFFFKAYLFGTGGIWVAITVTIVVEAQLGSTLIKSIQRISGTIVGGAVGLGIVALVSRTGPDCFVCSYKVPVMLVLIFVSAFVFTYLRSKLAKYTYLFTLANLSMLIVVDGETDDPTTPSGTVIGTAYWVRMVAVTIGICIGFIVTLTIFPNRSSARLRAKLVEILRVDLVNAFDEVIDTLVEETMVKAPSAGATLAGAVAASAAAAAPEGILVSPSAPNLTTAVEAPGGGGGEEGQKRRREQLHLSLVRSAEDLEGKLAKINNKISECRDLLKVSDGEPIRRGWRLEWLPVEDWREVILKVGAIFNLAVPLIYLLRLDSEDPLMGRFDMLLDFYHQELLDVKAHIGVLLASIADYLGTGDEEAKKIAFGCLDQFTAAVHAIDKKHDQLSKEEWKFPVSEVQALYQVRLSVHFLINKSRRLIEVIEDLGWRRGHYLPKEKPTSSRV